MWKKILSISLSLLMIWFSTVAILACPPTNNLTTNVVVSSETLVQLVNKSYIELLEIAPTTNFSSKEIDDFKKKLDKEKDLKKDQLKQEEKQIKKEVKKLRKQLDKLNKESSADTLEMKTKRQNLHCQIFSLEKELKEKRTHREHGLSVNYDNKVAKLDLLEQWPTKLAEIEQIQANNKARERRFGDVEDIGIRKVREGQEKDIRLGEEALQRLKSSGLLPPIMEDKELNNYLQNLANLIASKSDLTIPVQIFLLDSDEINAFALPGGYLFVNRGLLEKAETESELVGVLAHELAHVSARHGARLMKKANIAGMFFQAAQIAALIFTGGVAGIGMYYALNYGFFGLGLVLDLALLGVSRDYEMEADQLGVQYAWNAGYDPRGFITFFDKMASEKGYVKSASFFRTHPAFFDRIVSTFSEISYLPVKNEVMVDSSDFQKAKEKLVEITPNLESNNAKVSLKKTPDCD